MRTAVLLALVLACHGCAITSKADPLEPRYFSVEAAFAREGQPAPAPEGLDLRLRGIKAAAHLRERFVYRRSEFEYELSELDRWAEPPDAMLLRGLERVLFEERGVRQALSGSVATLEVELRAFEAFASGRVRVELVLLLHDEQRARLEETIRVERPVSISDDDPDARPAAVAKGLGQALREALDLAADRIVKELSSGA